LRRLLTWHALQPLVYCLVLALYWEALDDPDQEAQRYSAYLVLSREAAHVFFALVCLWVNPLFLLVDLRDTLDHSINAWGKLAVVVFAPWAFTLRALLGQGTQSTQRYYAAGNCSATPHSVTVRA
jgi:hypothetical protein